MHARRLVAVSTLVTAVAAVGLVAPKAQADQISTAPAPNRAQAAEPQYVVTRVTVDQSQVRVSGLKTVAVRYTVTMTNGRDYGSYAQLRLRQLAADGRPAAPNTVNVVMERSDDPAAPDTFTGTLRVSAAVGPRLVPLGMVHPAYDDPGEICMADLGGPDCAGMVPATGPALTVIATHRPRLTVSTVPAVTAVPAKVPSRYPQVPLRAVLVDATTGRQFATAEKVQLVVGLRSRNDNCRYKGNSAVLSTKGTARWSMSAESQHGLASGLDDGPHCAILLRAGEDPWQLNDPIAYVDNVARITVPVSVTAPASWRTDRSIPITAKIRTYAGEPGTMRIQRLHGRSVWRTVGLTKMRSPMGGLEYQGSMRIPAKGKGTAVYRVQVFSGDERFPLTTSTSATFRVR